MNETISISVERFAELLAAEIHLGFILDAEAKAKYSHDIQDAVKYIRSIRDPEAQVNDDAE